MEDSILITRTTLVVMAVLIPFCEATACSIGSLQYLNSMNCLQAVQTATEDTNRFWFGNNYSNNCNGKPEFDSECYNPRSNFRDSLATRIFQTRAYNRNTLRSVLTVTYKTYTGRYEACGNTYHIDKDRIVTIDPLADDMDLTPFECKSRPVVTWETIPQSYSTYTLAIIDAGYLTIQALYINIPGNFLDDGETVVEYQPPLNPTLNNNPYVFLLFEQSSSIALRPETLHDLSFRTLKAFNDFLNQNNLQGPVGISWLTLRADPYSADNAHKSPGRMNTCAHFVNEALKDKNIPYLPQNRPDLSTYIDITFDSPAFHFSCCCNKYSRKHAIFKPNPIGDGISDAAIMRVNATFVFHKSTAFPSRIRDFGNDLYTMVMVDPLAYSSKALPHMHMLVTNIPNGDLYSGEHVLPYIGPWTSHTYYHRYYFLLFKQTVTNFQLQPDYYAYKNCSTLFRGRCGFNMAALIRDGGLELVGASWQRVRLSNYVRCIYANLPEFFSESEQCASVPGYSPTCSESGMRSESSEKTKNLLKWLITMLKPTTE